MGFQRRISLVLLALIVAVAVPLGCGAGKPDCTYKFSILPLTATLDHTVSGNSQTYTAVISSQPGCNTALPVPPPAWKVSDTVDASIDSDGVATCKSAAASPITVSNGTFGTATLICK